MKTVSYSEILELTQQLQTIKSPAIDPFFPVVKSPALWMGEALLGFNLQKRHFELYVNEAQYNIMLAKRDEVEAAAVLHSLEIKVMPTAKEALSQALQMILSNQIPDSRLHNSRMNYYDF